MPPSRQESEGRPRPFADSPDIGSRWPSRPGRIGRILSKSKLRNTGAGDSDAISKNIPELISHLGFVDPAGYARLKQTIRRLVISSMANRTPSRPIPLILLPP